VPAQQEQGREFNPPVLPNKTHKGKMKLSPITASQRLSVYDQHTMSKIFPTKVKNDLCGSAYICIYIVSYFKIAKKKLENVLMPMKGELA
jgi:hypothetical protein